MQYECGIIGGGLAGLSLAIQLAEKGHEVVVFEKEDYPLHRVCGEYIGMESWNFLCALGLPIADMQLPRITKLRVSAPNGNLLQHKLQPGGFGISRYTLDAMLADAALKKGIVFVRTKVNDILFSEGLFYIDTQQGKYTTQLAVGSFGKRSNLDIKMQRSFVQKPQVPVNNYVGIKYHVQLSFPADLIELHNFENGYCGISKVEENKYCLCYLTSANNLRNNGNDIKQMEEVVLMQNPSLKHYLKEATFLYDQPLVISQISFSPKSLVEDNVIMVGDAAGLITPLCGNGMSIALHSSKIAAMLASQYLNNKITITELTRMYVKQWRRTFSLRLSVGRRLQGLFGQPTITNIAISALKNAPVLVNRLIGLTHGNEF